LAHTANDKARAKQHLERRMPAAIKNNDDDLRAFSHRCPTQLAEKNFSKANNRLDENYAIFTQKLRNK
jgi:hypothetical protein